VIAARLVRDARRRAGLSQRQLAVAAGVPQSTVARIELARLSPRVDTLDRLLAAAGQALSTEPRLGIGVDRTQIRELLRLTPGQRARLAAADAAALNVLERARCV
jgi:transcriptional regulator with XRE-family HTH domain